MTYPIVNSARPNRILAGIPLNHYARMSDRTDTKAPKEPVHVREPQEGLAASALEPLFCPRASHMHNLFF
jgi:hypothetical protein